ncbi:DUF2786 domain-containing protein [Sporanaerobacter acetigenes]|uniref:Uncharacterized protein n=1 Tax=Sporanaerobacter acetigenes DSM 13106 TaxID=1123281 RepID=A0A1M5U295_9FIRM|nr:DUF2786 domain-containing protein [Sporanaerobacter acetigenes]SHH56763.1 Protein of unknown function [Sporanaerobacter acetigenes DSM 13106]
MENNIIIKIKKLLALSESSNEYEAKVAMLKAQELLAKHKLSLKEIEEHEDINVMEGKTNITFRQGKWKGKLADLIAENFGCYHYYGTNRTHTIIFMGKDEDVTVCKMVLEYAVDSINSVVNRLRYQYRKEGYSTKGLENDYALGFIEGLEYAFEEQKQENQEWGLVLARDKEVVEAYEKKEFIGSINTNTNFQGFNEAYFKGVEDGEKFSISDKIVGDEKGTLQIENRYT